MGTPSNASSPPAMDGLCSDGDGRSRAHSAAMAAGTVCEITASNSGSEIRELVLDQNQEVKRMLPTVLDCERESGEPLDGGANKDWELLFVE